MTGSPWVEILSQVIDAEDWAELCEDTWRGEIWMKSVGEESLEVASFPSLSWWGRLSLRLGDWVLLYDWRDLGYLAYECRSYSEFLETLGDRLERFLR